MIEYDVNGAPQNGAVHNLYNCICGGSGSYLSTCLSIHRLLDFLPVKLYLGEGLAFLWGVLDCRRLY